jgi:hypothetical protein
VQLPQVMDGGVELPLAAAAPEAAHAEAVGALPVFHLPEHGFDRGPALAVSTGLGISPIWGAQNSPLWRAW